MRTLEPKDICGYLPYGLKICIWDEERKRSDGIFKVGGIYNGIYLDDTYDISDSELCSISYDLYMPVLRPLSDLDKTITHNGREIVPIVELAALAQKAEGWKYDKEYECAVSESRDFWFCYDTLCCGFRLQTGYGDNVMIDNCIALYDYLNELKIDYRGLIDDGLAVSVYDLENNPYK